MIHAPATLRLELFGGPRIHGPAGEVGLSPYQMAMVVLVYSEESMSRPDIARILWRGQAEARTRPSIRQLIHGIGRRLGESVFDAKGDILSVQSSLSSDLQQYRSSVEDGRLMDAAAYLREGFVSTPLRGLSGEFLDWRDAFAADLERSLVHTARTSWEVHSGASDWQRARDAAEAMYLLKPGDSDVAARVIEARARGGKIHSAEAAYAEYCERRSDKQEPHGAVDEVITRVRSLRDEFKQDEEAFEVPFVGRREILEDLTSVFKDVRSGVFSFVLIAGEAGIGKTRLLAELERAAHLEGIRCLRAQPVEVERRIALNPIIDALSIIDLEGHLTALGEPWRTVIGSLLPPGSLEDPIGDLPPIDELSLPRRLLDAVSLLLERLAAEQPTVLFLDDLQWADATTIAALQFFQRRWSASPFGVIATIRPGAVGPRNPISHYLADDGKLDVRKVELGELLEDEARQLIRLVGEGRIEETAVPRLFALAGLHPLYLTELARDYLADRLHLTELSPAAINIPISLQQILAARTEKLSGDARKVADMLAVGAKAMRLTDIARLIGILLDNTADAAEELKQAGLVSLDRDKVWITHDLFRSAIYNELNEPHRAVLHHKFAEHLQSEASEESAEELSIHYDRAGDAKLSAKHGWIAAARALERGAVAEAAHFYQLVTRNEKDETRRAEATALLATTLHQNRDIRRANPALELASARLRLVGMVKTARRIDIRRVEGLQEAGHTPVDELVERLTAIKSESRLAEDWEAVALALDAELQLLHRAGDILEIRAVFGEMRSVADIGVPEASAACHLGLAMGVLFGDPDEALTSAQLAVRLTDTARSHRPKALLRLMVALQLRGRLQQPGARKIVEEARELARQSGDVQMRFNIESNVAVALLDAGELDQAEEMLERSTEMLGSADMDLNRFNQANNHAELALANSDYIGATEWFTKAGTYLGLTLPPYAHRLVDAGLGLCALELGDLSEARRREELVGPLVRPWFFDPSTLLAFKVRLLERREKRTEALELLEESADDVFGRLDLAWLKISRLRLAKMLKWGRTEGASELVHSCIELSRDLHLHRRLQQFEGTLERLEEAL